MAKPPCMMKTRAPQVSRYRVLTSVEKSLKRLRVSALIANEEQSTVAIFVASATLLQVFEGTEGRVNRTVLGSWGS